MGIFSNCWTFCDFYYLYIFLSFLMFFPKIIPVSYISNCVYLIFVAVCTLFLVYVLGKQVPRLNFEDWAEKLSLFPVMILSCHLPPTSWRFPKFGVFPPQGAHELPGTPHPSSGPRFTGLSVEQVQGSAFFPGMLAVWCRGQADLTGTTLNLLILPPHLCFLSPYRAGH